MNEIKDSREQTNNKNNQYYSQFNLIPLISQHKYQDIKNTFILLNQSSSLSSPIKEWNFILINHFIQQSSKSLFAFQTYFSNNKTKATNYIIKLNEIIYYYKTNQYKKCIKEFISFMIKEKKNFDNNTLSYIFITNCLLCLIEISLLNDNTNTGRELLEFFEKRMTKTNQMEEKFNNTNEIIYPYLNEIECFNENNSNFNEVILLFKCNIHLLEKNYDKAKRNLDDYKIIYISSSQNKNKYPLYHRMKEVYNMLKVKVDYFTNASSKFSKHLQSLLAKYEKEDSSLLFYYNSLSICNLKNKNYKLSQYYLLLCNQIISRNFDLNIRLISTIKYNFALCYFYQKEYGKCLTMLTELCKEEQFEYNPFIYYRIGLCLIEQYRLKQNKRTVYHFNSNSVILQSKNKDNYESITTAILMFKKTITLIRNQKKFISNRFKPLEEYLQSVNSTSNNSLLYNSKKQPKSKSTRNNNYINKYGLNQSNSKNNYHLHSFSQIYILSYINLLFSLSIIHSYKDIIFYANTLSIQSSENLEISITPELQYQINNYLLQAYINLNQTEKAIEIMKNSKTIPDMKGAFLHISSNQFQSDLHYKIALCVNAIRLNISLNKNNETIRGINQLIRLISKESNIDNNLPVYLVDLIVYYLLKVDKKEIAIEFIKTRRIPDIILNYEKNTK